MKNMLNLGPASLRNIITFFCIMSATACAERRTFYSTEERDYSSGSAIAYAVDSTYFVGGTRERGVKYEFSFYLGEDFHNEGCALTVNRVKLENPKTGAVVLDEGHIDYSSNPISKLSPRHPFVVNFDEFPIKNSNLFDGINSITLFEFKIEFSLNCRSFNQSYTFSELFERRSKWIFYYTR